MGSRHQKRIKVDRISSLHDSILTHMLSFLSTKDAIVTSFLSRRWRCLWKKVPAIHLDYEDEMVMHYNKTKHYKTIINNVLFHNKESCLRFCRLNIPEDALEHADGWLDDIMKRSIKELYLKAFPEFTVPSSIFTCENLVVLTLTEATIPELPTSVHLPNLQVLNFIGLEDPNNKLCLAMLTSSCPVLRELTIEAFGGYLEYLTVSSSTLKILCIFTCIMDTLVINASSLEYLAVSQEYPFRYDVSNLSSLKEAYIGLETLNYDGSIFDCQTNNLMFINSLTSLTTLCLHQMMLRHIQDHIPDQLQAFDNLTCLELELCESCSCIVTLVLERTPNLVDLTVKCDRTKLAKKKKCSHVTNVPSCLLNSIEVIEVRDFSGSKGDTEMIRYLLLNGKVLNEMIIRWFCPSQARKIKILTKLMSFPRSSSTCRVKCVDIFEP